MCKKGTMILYYLFILICLLNGYTVQTKACSVLPHRVCTADQCIINLKENTSYCGGYDELNFDGPKIVHIVGREGTILHDNTSDVTSRLYITTHGVHTLVLSDLKIQQKGPSVINSFINFNQTYDFSFIQMRNVIIQTDNKHMINIYGPKKKIHISLEHNKINKDITYHRRLCVISSDCDDRHIDLTLYQNDIGKRVDILGKNLTKVTLTEASTRNVWSDFPTDKKLMNIPFIHPDDPNIMCHPPGSPTMVKKVIKDIEKWVYICCLREWLEDYAKIDTKDDNKLIQTKNKPVKMKLIEEEEIEKHILNILYVPAWETSKNKTAPIIDLWVVNKSVNVWSNISLFCVDRIVLANNVYMSINSYTIDSSTVVSQVIAVREIIVLERSNMKIISHELKETSEQVDKYGTEHRLYVSITAETSNIWFLNCVLTQINLISSGMGHVHVQNTNMVESILSATNAWISKSSIQDSEIVTMPYTGHLHTSTIHNSDVVFSPFSLGNEPEVRYALRGNNWGGHSNLMSFEESYIQHISVVDESVGSESKIEKIPVSQKRTKYVLNKDSRRYTDMYHIYTKNEPETQYFTGGLSEHDRKYLMRHLTLKSSSPYCAPGDDQCSEENDYKPPNKVSYLNSRSGSEMKEDCRNAIMRCYGFTEDDLDNRCLTLNQWLNPANKPNATSEYCIKASLYCIDISGCDSQIIKPKALAIIVFSAVTGFVVFFLAYNLLCTRPTKFVTIDADHLDDKTCYECGYPNEKGAIFCCKCATAYEDFKTTTVANIASLGDL